MSRSRCLHCLSVCGCLDDTPVATAKRLPGESEEERDSSGRLWRTVIIGDQEQRIDMQVIRPYLRVVTHGGQQDSVSLCSGSKHQQRQRACRWIILRNSVTPKTKQCFWEISIGLHSYRLCLRNVGKYQTVKIVFEDDIMDNEFNYRWLRWTPPQRKMRKNRCSI